MHYNKHFPSATKNIKVLYNVSCIKMTLREKKCYATLNVFCIGLSTIKDKL